MKTVKLRLNSAEDIGKFVNAATLYANDVDLRSGRYVVDGKSIMGLFSLNLAETVEADVYGDHPEELIGRISEFLAETE